MPSVLTHDHAIAQKENPRKRRHHDRSRSEDEKKLTPAEDLPAEIPLLPCTPLVTRNSGLKFPSPKKRRWKAKFFDDGPIDSRKRIRKHNERVSTKTLVVQSPARVSTDNSEAETSDPTSSDVKSLGDISFLDNGADSFASWKSSMHSSITPAEVNHVPYNEPIQEAALTATSHHKSCYEEQTNDIEPDNRGLVAVVSPQHVEQTRNNSPSDSPRDCYASGEIGFEWLES